VLGEVTDARRFLRERYPDARLGPRRHGDDLEAGILAELCDLGASYDDIAGMRAEHPEFAALVPQRSAKVRRDLVSHYRNSGG
jgi:hypothetical protein